MKYGAVRIMKQHLNKSTKSGNRYYKSFKQQYEHDLRIETMDSTYLKRPNEQNNSTIFINVDDVEEEWAKCQKQHIINHNKKIQKQTKETLNFLLSFSKDFDLPEEERVKQYNIVKQYITEHYDYPVYLVQHNDEKSLHYSFSVLNFSDKTSRPISKQIDTSSLQDEVFNYLKKYNVDYGHTRGQSKTISLAKHRTIMEGKVAELKEDNKKLIELNTQYKLDTENLKKLYEDGVNEIADELYDLLNDENSASFAQKLYRAVRGKSKERLEKLIAKIERIQKAKAKAQTQNNTKGGQPL